MSDHKHYHPGEHQHGHQHDHVQGVVDPSIVPLNVESGRLNGRFWG